MSYCLLWNVQTEGRFRVLGAVDFIPVTNEQNF
jgi:hypothetical protein